MNDVVAHFCLAKSRTAGSYAGALSVVNTPVRVVVAGTGVAYSRGIGAVPNNANSARRRTRLHPREDRGRRLVWVRRKNAGVIADSDRRTPGITLVRREPDKNIMV